MAAATYLGAYGDYATSPHIGGGGNHPYFYYCCVDGNNGVQQTAANSTIFTARMLMTCITTACRSIRRSSCRWATARLATAIPSRQRGSTATLAIMEGPTARPSPPRRGSETTYDGQGVYSHDSGDHIQTPFNCSGCGAYFQVVNIQTDVITPRTANSTRPRTGARPRPRVPEPVIAPSSRQGDHHVGRRSSTSTAPSRAARAATTRSISAARVDHHQQPEDEQRWRGPAQRQAKAQQRQLLRPHAVCDLGSPATSRSARGTTPSPTRSC